MCGIGGIATIEGVVEPSKIMSMEKAMFHRGPDDGETWLSEDLRVGLCHRRLSILDLSPTGHQPMHSLDGRYTIVFNGEIYNFGPLRDELIKDGTQLRSTGDTEVVLNLFVKKGLACLAELEGMFAFAVWDHRGKVLSLARDPLGIKPLYVYQDESSIAFASELRALSKVIPSRSINKTSLVGYLLTGSVPEEQTLLDGVQMLPAGATLTWTGVPASPKIYWQPKFETATRPSSISEPEAVRLIREALLDTVRRHFVSDVPVGIFLSGGIDSTALVALARQAGIEQIKTFSISFEEVEYDEGSIAERTAKHFGTDHHVWRMTAKQGQELFEQHLSAMDQPSNDGFNTYCVSKFAHDHGLKVVLSGLGGDELFGSYPSFRLIPMLVRASRYYRMLPFGKSVARAAQRLLRASGPRARLFEFMQSSGSVADAYLAIRGYFDRKACAAIASKYSESVCEFDELFSAVSRDAEKGLNNDWQIADQISYLELTRYMRNQLLRDSDVMSMAWSLELRVPLVDRKLFESVAQVPADLRLANGKQLLVDAVGDIPKWVLEQPKRGFRFPFQVWMENDSTWKQRFSKILDQSPVKLDHWYQRWMLFVLDKSLQSLGVAS
ncbi:MAG: asparagine synthase (glutamine-hydrolyzing) [Pirellulales bacterium]